MGSSITDLGRRRRCCRDHSEHDGHGEDGGADDGAALGTASTAETAVLKTAGTVRTNECYEMR